MSKTVIQISNLGKQYRLGQVGTTTIADDLKRFWYNVRGKEDPFLKVGEENDRSKATTSEYVWALKDVSFSVNQGDVLGIIGKNGAGKSTLLKILSRTTSPSIGEYKIKGKVASLLEVGTGFHPDLTGKENIYLNGAILGMSKQEINKQFDAIVDFSGVERYIDTPVKRYSSGMYVRLAFAVAAHLNPDILIVDEVLAVGDAEFQRKCLGKMKDVSGQGRTVLFVSHNLTTIRSLCNKTLYLKNGKCAEMGNTSNIIDNYLNSERVSIENGVIPENAAIYKSEVARFTHFFVKNTHGKVVDALYYEQPVVLEFSINVNQAIQKTLIDFSIGSIETRFTYTSSFDFYRDYITLEKGIHHFSIQIHPKLIPGNYTFYLGLHDFTNGSITLDFIERISIVNVLNFKETTGEKFPLNASFGNVRIDGNWIKK